jgi:hypothetical protein
MFPLLIAGISLEQCVVDDVRLLRESPLIRKEMVLRGFLWDIHTGILKEIECNDGKPLSSHI